MITRWSCSKTDKPNCCSHDTLFPEATWGFKRRDAVNYTLNPGVRKTESLRDSDTHPPVRWTIHPGAAQTDPELRELSLLRSGLAVRRVKSHWPVSESLPCFFVWPCHFSRLLEPGSPRGSANFSKVRPDQENPSRCSKLRRRRHLCRNELDTLRREGPAFEIC